MSFVNATEAARLLCLTDKHGNPRPHAVKPLLDEWGIPSYYLGSGRGRGWRWDRQDVVAALKRRAAPSAGQQPAKGQGRDKRQTGPSLAAMSTADAIALLTSGGRRQ